MTLKEFNKLFLYERAYILKMYPLLALNRRERLIRKFAK